MYFKKIIISLVLCFFGSIVAAQTQIVTTLKPFYLITKPLADEHFNVTKLLPDSASPHGYHLKPSQARQLHQAELVIWGMPTLEPYLVKYLSNINREKQLALGEQPNIELLPMRHSHVFEGHDDHDEHHHHEHHHDEHGADPHFWLSPSNAKIMVQLIAKQLINLKPSAEKDINQRAQVLIERINISDQNIAKQLLPVKDVPFMVFHDAYQYFEKHFQLNVRATLHLDPHIPLTVKQLAQIDDLIQAKAVKTVFFEPQFDSKILTRIVEKTRVSSQQVDPLGAMLPQNSDFADLLMTMGESIYLGLKKHVK